MSSATPTATTPAVRLRGVVKRFDVDAVGVPRLVSENPAYDPIPITGGVRVQGRVVHLLRDFG